MNDDLLGHITHNDELFHWHMCQMTITKLSVQYPNLYLYIEMNVCLFGWMGPHCVGSHFTFGTTIINLKFHKLVFRMH